MPLNKSGLEQALKAMYEDTSSQKSMAEFASKTANCMYDFAISGTPMTTIITLPGAVAVSMTAGPVMGTGVGGIDKASPGMGLLAAKALLEITLVQIYTHNNSSRSAAQMARQMADAVYNYFSQAMVLTNETSGSPLPAPPPVGPVSGSLTGMGGVLSVSGGKGYSLAKRDLEEALKAIYSDLSQKAVSQSANQMANALHAFFIEGKVQTTGTFTAVAAVDPLTLTGAYSAGTGSSVSGSLS
jgi:hypothetical protein